MHPKSPYPALRWDLFCKVIDNYGDIGVCWRLACNLAQKGQTVRLWVNDASALAWMAPAGAPGVQVLPWNTPLNTSHIAPGDVLVEAFGCDIAPEFITAYANHISTNKLKSAWINLEYLSAEDFSQRCHGLPSPVMTGPGAGLTKHFFYPGFTLATGGLLREADFLTRQANFDRAHWLTQQGIVWQGKRLISLFCYEPAALDHLLDQLANDQHQPTCLAVTWGRSNLAVKTCIASKDALSPLWNQHQVLSFCFLPHLTQTDFDHLLWACDVNFVRGEDSLVRALWAGKPLVWQIYPQHDAAHETKLKAFLDWLQPPQSLRRANAVWNNLSHDATLGSNLPLLPQQDMATWHTTIANARKALLKQPDLVNKLLELVLKTH